MLAIKNGSTHLNVANVMAKMDPNLVTLKLNSGSTVSKWAQEKGHDVFFKVCFVTFSVSPLCCHFNILLDYLLGILCFVLKDPTTWYL